MKYPSLLKRCRLLPLTAAMLLAGQTALAAQAYVSNEKDDTISIIDLETLEVTETLNVGERPRAFCSPRTTANCISAPRTQTPFR